MRRQPREEIFPGARERNVFPPAMGGTVVVRPGSRFPSPARFGPAIAAAPVFLPSPEPGPPPFSPSRKRLRRRSGKDFLQHGRNRPGREGAAIARIASFREPPFNPASYLRHLVAPGALAGPTGGAPNRRRLMVNGC